MKGKENVVEESSIILISYKPDLALCEKENCGKKSRSLPFKTPLIDCCTLANILEDCRGRSSEVYFYLAGTVHRLALSRFGRASLICP